jgi:hypothetical protein
MNFGSMLDTWMDLPDWAIFATLVAGYGATGLAMFGLCFTFSGQPRLARFTGVVAPFLGAPHVIFALTAVFLANDARRHTQEAEAFLLDEKDGALMLQSLSSALPATGPSIVAATRTYIGSVLADEWGTATATGSPKTGTDLAQLFRTVAAKPVMQESGAAVQSALVANVLKIANARSGRLALRDEQVDGVKWIGAQIGIAAVHVERWRAQAVALAIFTASVVTILGIIAACERPLFGENQISAAPLYVAMVALKD